MSRSNSNLSSIFLGLACLVLSFALKAAPGKPKTTLEDLAQALRSGDWRAGTNLGVEIYRARKTDDFLEQAIGAFEDHELFMKRYDLNSDGSIDKNEFRGISESDKSNYPILFYNLGRAFIDKEEWDKAGKSLRTAAECPLKSDSKFRAMHDYSILVAKNMIEDPKQPFANLGMAFQPSEPRKPMAVEGKPFDYNAVLSDLMSKGLKDVSPKAHRNLLTDKKRREYLSLYQEIHRQVERYKNLQGAIPYIINLIKNYDALSRPDSYVY